MVQGNIELDLVGAVLISNTEFTVTYRLANRSNVYGIAISRDVLEATDPTDLPPAIDVRSASRPARFGGYLADLIFEPHGSDAFGRPDAAGVRWMNLVRA